MADRPTFPLPPRPVLWLDNWGRAQQLVKSAQATRLLSAQAGLRWRRQGAGWVWACAPKLEDLHAVQRGTITPDVYFQRCRVWWGEGSALRHLAPGELRVYSPDGGLLADPAWNGLDLSYVGDGDVLCCTCAAPGSPKRKHACHIEPLVELLAQADDGTGWTWDVRLYGRPWPPQQDQQDPSPAPASPSPRPRRLAGRQKSLLEPT